MSDLKHIYRRVTLIAKAVMRRSIFQETTLTTDDLIQVGVLAWLERQEAAHTNPEWVGRRAALDAMYKAIKRDIKQRHSPVEFTRDPGPVLPRKVKRALRGMRKAERTILGRWLDREKLSEQEFQQVYRAQRKLKRFMFPTPPKVAVATTVRRCGKGHEFTGKRCPECQRAFRNASYRKLRAATSG